MAKRGMQGGAGRPVSREGQAGRHTLTLHSGGQKRQTGKQARRKVDNTKHVDYRDM